MMRRYTFCLIIIILSTTQCVFAQLEMGNLASNLLVENPSVKKHRWTIGGNVFLSFESNNRYAEVSGKIGYFIFEDFMPYAKIKYFYNYNAVFSLSSNIIGAAIGLSYFIPKTPLTLAAEYENITSFSSNTSTVSYNNILAGGGLNFRLTENVYTQLNILIQLNPEPLVPILSFPSPRFNFTILYLF